MLRAALLAVAVLWPAAAASEIPDPLTVRTAMRKCIDHVGSARQSALLCGAYGETSTGRGVSSSGELIRGLVVKGSFTITSTRPDESRMVCMIAHGASMVEAKGEINGDVKKASTVVMKIEATFSGSVEPALMSSWSFKKHGEWQGLALASVAP